MNSPEWKALGNINVRNLVEDDESCLFIKGGSRICQNQHTLVNIASRTGHDARRMYSTLSPFFCVFHAKKSCACLILTSEIARGEIP